MQDFLDIFNLKESQIVKTSIHLTLRSQFFAFLQVIYNLSKTYIDFIYSYINQIKKIQPLRIYAQSSVYNYRPNMSFFQQ